MATYGEQLTIGHIPHLHARNHREASKVAVVEGSTRLTWADVSTRTAKLAHALKNLGIDHGSKIATVLSNQAQYVEIVYSIAGLGAIVAPVSYKFTAGEIKASLEQCQAEVIITDDSAIDQVKLAAAEIDGRTLPIIVISDNGDDHGCIEYERFIAAESAELDYFNMSEWDVFHLAFTGGTSGSPKACEIPQRIARQGWYDITVEVGNRRDDVTAIAGPFYHGLGFTWGLQQLMVGGTLVMLRDFDGEELLKVIETESITFLPMVPTMFELLLNCAAKHDYDVSSVKRLMSAGAPLLTATKQRLLGAFNDAELYELYGSTEAGFFSVLRPEDQLRKTRCAGLPYFGCDLRILNADGNDVANEEVGQIYKRGLALGAYYEGNSVATEAQFEDEWITSGDLGYFDEEKYLYVVDRAKDMIISGGVNIYPTEIENVLVSHPDVLEVAVIGVPDDIWGEVVTACIVTREGRPLPTEELKELCTTQLAKFKIPRSYIEFSELPKNAAGKLLKKNISILHP